MIEKVSVSCPVCDSDNYTVVFEPTVDITDPASLYGAASGLPGTQRIVKCKACGMIYENPRYQDEVILSGYMASQEAGHDSQYPMRVESFYRALKGLSKHLPPQGAKVLDIGTAGGAFLDAAKKYGYRASGLEPSEYLVQQGVKRGLDIRQGTIESNPFERGSFDMVCLWDVLEHLTDPKGSLLRIKPFLKPGGVLFINFPDIGTLMAKIAGRRFWWLISVHLHHFSRRTIVDICKRSGYEVFHIERYWQTLQFGYLQDMAIHFKIPLSSLFKSITPGFIQRMPIKYYASQTSAIARVKS